MVRKEYEIGFYLTDASFDKRTNLSTISVLNLITNKNKSFTKSFENTKEAELFGILEGIKDAYSMNYKHLIVMCDNLSSVNEMKYQISKTNYWKNKFNTVQILWIPRDQTFLADFFSKNMEINKKEEYIETKLNKYSENLNLFKISNMIITDIDKYDLINNKVKTLLSNYPELKSFNYKSQILKKIINNESYTIGDKVNIDELKKDIMDLISINYALSNKKNELFYIMEFILNEFKY